MSLRDFMAGANGAPPARLGQRYDAEGFLPDPGNTVVCALDLDTRGGAAVVRARERIMGLPGAERLLFTPVESLHMTVFEGVLDGRRQRDAWPDFCAMEAPVAEVTAQMVERFQGFEAPARFEVAVQGVGPTGLALCGAAGRDAAALVAWRDALSGAFGYRQREHDAYRHHMTFAYPVDWLPDAVLPAWEAGLAQIMSDLVAEGAVLPLRPPAFCTFEDMTWFEEVVRLA